MNNISLIDKYLPEYTFSEYHSIVVNSSIEDAYQVSRDFDLSKSKLIKILFSIRFLPTKRMNLQGFISDIGFTNIEEKVPTENLIGFWARNRIEPILSYDDFIKNTISPRIKVIWNFKFEKINDIQTKVSTETRVLCLNIFTKLFFGFYWLIIKFFSGEIRKSMLKIIKNDAEALKS